MTKNLKAAAKRSVPKSKPPQPSKKEQFIALLGRETGATIAEIVEATGWQPHSTRAMLTGLRKLGRTIEKTKAEGVTRYTLRGEIPA